MAQTEFRPADDDAPGDSQSSPERSPWPVFALLILGAIALGMMWWFVV
jgi:hypothetical protein